MCTKNRIYLDPAQLLDVVDIEDDIEYAVPPWPGDRKMFSGGQAEIELVVDGQSNEATRRSLHAGFAGAIVDPYTSTNYCRSEMNLFQAVSGMKHMPKYLGSAQKKRKLYVYYEPWYSHTLRDWINQPKSITNPFTREELRKTGAQFMVCLASTLHNLHAVKPQIEHHDIKPENICITPSGDIMFVDFGVGRLCTLQAIRESYVGTETYMAPETYAKGPHTKRAEMFSLGAVFAEILVMMAGCQVEHGLHVLMRKKPYCMALRKVQRCIEDLKRRRPDIKELADIVVRMLSTNPSNRPTAWEVHKELLKLGIYKCCNEPKADELEYEDSYPISSSPKLEDCLFKLPGLSEAFNGISK
ncbi:serine/threonine protein kinase [Spizellomyces punctatus DAOM BR117]|uniref:Serine/threonine protein kinase n=1 Tax=Spizellomyces punctatus (strain DAOM BR117) TaxID=645134 RepID=A0A0L0HJQ8_SPIPD|nr:serine/threonine protein kinase [Spizellomyces punctatus DAOM BR117]KND01268.1 serine/threonine protein kinase [Spizellomyces punctatus DAOM BR117]|eukprot:XP_016609307.1 serine/threonine protein kinase [Spizellomyces punctatus DAOM BR117]